MSYSRLGFMSYSRLKNEHTKINRVQTFMSYSRFLVTCENKLSPNFYVILTFGKVNILKYNKSWHLQDLCHTHVCEMKIFWVEDVKTCFIFMTPRRIMSYSRLQIQWKWTNELRIHLATTARVRRRVCPEQTNLRVTRLSFNRSQLNDCSTKYDTPTQT